MKVTYISATIAFGTASFGYAHPQARAGWVPAGPNDVRAPCPMLNTLANHGYLPHSGKAITQNKTVEALKAALNFAEDLSAILFEAAVGTNPTPNATTFDLDHLGRHNVLEHDGSLSRADNYFGPGNQSVFNEVVFNQTKSFWTGDVITMQMAANARASRLMTSNLTNPEFELSDTGSIFSIGESAAYVTVLGDKVSRTVPKSYVEYLFENERLPYELGFKRPATPYTGDDLVAASNEIVALQSFPQSPGKGL
ncbi:Cloroperoxidase [Hypoxylon rubiginosum]|uniref:Cloroperoxidase n=1 Tax=Hypoxylon rubiginosum TaxID=110542 RepID=A0ACC0CM59_9PEZI|nr:Cloroperoxidase [Hypoxylon rubiginosum]